MNNERKTKKTSKVLSQKTMMRQHGENISTQSQRFSYLPIAVLISAALASCLLAETAYADDYFNAHALDRRGAQPIADVENLSAFSRQNGQLPGTYSVDVYVNKQSVGVQEIAFVTAQDQTLVPELTKVQLEQWGVKLESFPELMSLADDRQITLLNQYIPDAESRFEFDKQRLNISIPQIAMKSTARGAVSPELWQHGISALTLSYGFNGSNTRDDQGNTQDSQFLSLRSGANFGAWRVRNYSTYTGSNEGRQWNNINSYLQRDIAFLRSQLTLGETASPGEIFDSFQFRGVQLVSDDEMLPYSLRGFAPIVRGIAQSDAQVTVSQNGFVIYQTYVAAGPFEINDLYPTSASGNLEVTIREADGTERTSVTPFSSVPIMQREGQLKYTLNGGKYRTNNAGSAEPDFLQSTLVYGLPMNTTLYGGGIHSADYQSTALGLGFNLGVIGALSADVTQAKADLSDGQEKFSSKGQSYRFQYAKSLLSSGTTVTLAGYRYSTGGFYDFAEANDYGNNNNGKLNKRSRVQLSFNQSLQEYGSVYLTGYKQNFWHQSGEERNLSAGYNVNFGSISYGVNYSHTDTPGNTVADQLVSFNVSIPLDKFLSNSRMTSSFSTDRNGMSNSQLGVSGTALDNALSYSVQQGFGNQGQGGSGSSAVAYRGAKGTVNTGYSYSSNSQRLNYGVEGGLVVHPYGVTLSQTLGNTIALVKAPGADGVNVQNRTGIATDSRGYAVVPYIAPYQRNQVQLDVSSLADDVDLVSNSATVIPTRGAVVIADFATKVGVRTLIKLNYRGVAVPFGATASLKGQSDLKPDSLVSGIIGDGGEVYLSGMPYQGQLQVSWGHQPDQQCTAAFTLPQKKDMAVIQTQAECI